MAFRLTRDVTRPLVLGAILVLAIVVLGWTAHGLLVGGPATHRLAPHASSDPLTLAEVPREASHAPRRPSVEPAGPGRPTAATPSPAPAAGSTTAPGALA